MTTTQSEFGRLTDVYLRKPHDSFISQEKINREWKALNYLSAPDYSESIKEYIAFEHILQKENIRIHYFEKRDGITMDAIYCRDATITTDHGVILCHMGKLARQSEPQQCAITFKDEGIKILGSITGEGRIEGGDVAWLDTKTLLIGHGYRTNDEGFRQLTAILSPFDIDTIQVDLAHYKGDQDVFHLMSIFSPVDQDLAVVYPPLMTVRFRQFLIKRGIQLIEVPDTEFESMGCNVLAIAPRKCIMLSGNPVTKSRLAEAGCEVIEYHGEHISVKGGGGPTCLTRPLRREIILH